MLVNEPIQEEMTENGRFLRSFKSNGCSPGMVHHFQNLSNYALQVGGICHLCFRLLALLVLKMRVTKVGLLRIY